MNCIIRFVQQSGRKTGLKNAYLIRWLVTGDMLSRWIPIFLIYDFSLTVSGKLFALLARPWKMFLLVKIVSSVVKTSPDFSST